MYQLKDLRGALGDFFSGRNDIDRRGVRVCKDDCLLPFSKVDVWHQFRSQLKATYDSDIILPPQTVQALPPSEELPYGRCNPVLIVDPGSDLAETVGFPG